MLKRLFKGLYHFIWYTFAAIILSAAVLVTLVRLTLPDIGGYRDYIESWVSQYMGYPVEIHDINADWEGWTPHLYLSNINLRNKSGTTVISQFQSAHLSFDPIASITHRQLIPKQLIVSGLGLTLSRRQDGSINITGEASPYGTNEKLGHSELAEWLLKQKKISIQNAQVRLIDNKSGRDPVFFPNVTLDLRTYKDRLQIKGSAILPVRYGNSVDFSLDARGNILTTQWSGTLYVKAKAIHPHMFLAESSFSDIPVSGGFANIEAWTDWKNAKLVRFEGISSYEDFKLTTDNNQLSIYELGSHFAGQRFNNHNWDLNLQLDDLITDNGVWPQTAFNLRLDKNNEEGHIRYKGNLGYLKLDDIIPLLPQFQFLPDMLKDVLVDNNIQGVTYSTKFEDVNSQNHDSSITLNGFAGSAIGNLNDVKLLFNSNSATIETPSFYDEPIWFKKLQGDITLSTNNNWKIDLDHIYAQTSDFSIALSGTISEDGQISSPYTDLIIHMGPGDLEKVSDYLPHVVSGKVRRWMKNTIVGGDLISCDMVLRGYLSDFPFINSEGRFNVLAFTSDATLDYHPEWPPVDGIDADIVFDNDSLRVEASSGKIFNARISEATAIIEHLKAKNNRVKINGFINGHTNDAKYFITQSPLKNNKSLNELSQKQLTGDLELDLGLSIPLKKGPKQVEGKLLLTDANFESDFIGISLENINGVAEFTHDSTSVTGMSALYNNLPVDISISSDKDNKSLASNITLSGISDRDFILNQLSIFFPPINDLINNIKHRLDGSAKWSLTINNRFTESGALEKQLILSSDLKGLMIDIPLPIGKTKHQSAPIQLSTTILDSRINHIYVEYNSNVYADFQIDNTADFEVNEILIGLGKAIDQYTGNNGVFIAGNIDELSISDWLDFFDTLSVDADSDQQEFKQVDLAVNVSQLKLFKLAYDNVDLHVTRLQDGWEAILDSVDISGQMIIPKDMGTGTITLNLAKLKIPKDHSSEGDNKTDPGRIPRFNIKIDDFNYDDLNLGELSLNTSPINNGISIDTIQFIKPDLQISGVGRWIKENGINNTEFNLDLHADQLAAMLETFGYSKAAVEKGETSINLDASWSGTPMDFSLGNVNGTLNIDITKGQFLDLKQKAGRLFGLLSLQTLPRRLALDFTDLFSKGFPFDKIGGVFFLENGNAYTNNLVMRGPPADIIVTGRTGIQEQDYDQIVTVTPQVSDSLPVASALFGPIGMGIGAVIFLAGEMFESIPKQIDKILRYQYSITGSWDDPVIEKIKKGAEEKNGTYLRSEQTNNSG
jgi:uncharacterized protein (TIGR02099 family)